jgi:hypothetical protein
MTGLPNHNREAFLAARSQLESAGLLVTDPFDVCTSIAFKWSSDGTITPRELAELMRYDYEAILQSVGVVFIAGWRGSKGCNREFIFAKSIGLPIWDMDRNKFVDYYSCAVLIFADGEDQYH